MSTRIDHRHVARLLTLSRTGLGIAMLLRPQLVRSWLGDAVDQREVRVAVRALGARDLLLAIGTLRALDRGEPVRAWVTLTAGADAADAAATLVALPALPRRAVLAVALAAGSAALLVAGRDHLD